MAFCASLFGDSTRSRFALRNIGLLFVLTLTIAVAAILPASASALTIPTFHVQPSSTTQGANVQLTTEIVRSGTLSEGIRRATVAYPTGLQLTLPGTRCTTSQFSSDNCPSGSSVGTSVAEGTASLFGFSLASGSVPGTAYALTNGTVGIVLRPAGFSKLLVVQTLSTSGGKVTAITNLPKKIKLFGLFDLDFSIGGFDYVYASTVAKNPTTCGINTSSLSLLAWNGATGVKTSSFTTVGCGGDTSDPVVDITAPAAGPSAANPVAVTYDVTDNDPVLDCAITNNDNPATSPVTLDEGSNTILVTCDDTAGNSGSDSVVVSWTAPDTSDPVVDITAPAAGPSAANPVAVTYDVTDNDPVLDCAITNNDNPATSPVTLDEGSNTILVTCDDTAGNSGSDSVVVSWTAPDTSDPVVDITAPAAGPSAANPVAVTYDVTDNDPVLDCAITNNDNPATSPVTLDEGSNTILVTCDDTAGNSGSDSVVVSWTAPDTSDPVVDITAPAAGPSAANPVAVTYDVTDNDPVLDCAITNNDNPATSPVTLDEGSNTILVTCDDTAGNSGSDSVVVSWTAPDTSDPVVDITAPAAGPSAANPVAVTYDVTDNDPVLDCAITNNDNPATSPVTLDEGSNTILVTCDDTAGNSGSDSVVVSWTAPDTSDPVVDITAPAAGPSAANPVAVTYDVTDNDPVLDCAITNNDNPATSPVTLDEGSNTILVTCDDTAGNSGSDSVVVSWTAPDTSDPVVDITAPAAGPSAANPVAVTYDVTDNDPVLDCAITNNDNPATSPVTLDEGSNTILVTCDDTAGNSGSDSVVVSWTAPDTSDPVVDITAPAAGPSAANPVAVTYDVTDNDPVLDCAITNNDNPATSPVTLDEGSNTILVTCDDTAGNSGSDSVVVSWTAPDTSDPVVDITAPAAGPSAANPVAVTYDVTDNDPVLDCAITNNDNPATSPVTLDEGSNTILVTCDDTAGNSGSDSVVVSWTAPDTSDPVVDITAPAAGPSAANPVAVTYDVTDNDPVLDCAITNNDNPATSPVTLDEGSNTILVTCDDTAGNSGSDSVVVSWTAPDTSDPVVDITAPAAGPSAANPVAVTYDVTDNDPVLDCAITNNDNPATSPVTLDEGSNTILVTCDDTAGNSGSDSVVVSWTAPDTSDPVVDITAPAAGPSAANPVAVTYDVTDNDPVLDCAITNNDNPATSPVTLDEGSNTILVTCDDTAGNSGSDSVVVSWTAPDTSDPVVDITAPAAGPSAANPVAVTYDVTDNDPVLDCAITNNDNPATSPVTLDEGSNTILVTCDDTAGNSGSDSVVVSWTAPDTSDPVVDITAPAAGPSAANPVAVTYDVTDNDPVLDCAITNNDNPATSPVTLDEGSNTILVTCDDTAGNSGSDSVVVSWTAPDTSDPVVDITAPAAGPSAANPVAVTYDVTDNDPVLDCAITNNDNPATSPVTLDEGSNTILVTCDDTAGNSGSDSVVVSWTAPDTSDPVVDITAPAAGPSAANPVAVTYDVTDNDPVLDCAITNDNPAPSPVTLDERPNTILVTCDDTAGNSGSDSVVVLTAPDTSDPVVDITAPAAGPTAANPVAVTYDVTNNDPVLDCAITNNDNPPTSPVTLDEGSNTILVTCDDTARTRAQTASSSPGRHQTPLTQSSTSPLRPQAQALQPGRRHLRRDRQRPGARFAITNNDNPATSRSRSTTVQTRSSSPATTRQATRAQTASSSSTAPDTSDPVVDITAPAAGPALPPVAVTYDVTDNDPVLDCAITNIDNPATSPVTLTRVQTRSSSPATTPPATRAQTRRRLLDAPDTSHPVVDITAPAAGRALPTRSPSLTT